MSLPCLDLWAGRAPARRPFLNQDPALRTDDLGGADLDWDRGIPRRDGAFTFTRTGTTTRAPFPDLSEEEKVRHKGELLYPNFFLSLSSDHVAAFRLAPDPAEIASPGFDPCRWKT